VAPTLFRKTYTFEYALFFGGKKTVRYSRILMVLLVLCLVLLAQANNGPQGDRSDPIATLTSYYNAINARDYRRAYSYWESPTSSFERFAAGFADTDRVRLLVEPPIRHEGAAGSLYAEITTIVVATTRAGNERVFAGCYVLRKSNVQDQGWHIYRADISAMPLSARVSRMLSQGCHNSQ
jgi:hypothetical protein